MQFRSNVPQNSFCIMEGGGNLRNNSDGGKSLKSYLTNLTTSPLMNQIGPEFAARPMVGLFRLKVARNCPHMAVSGARIVTYRSSLRTGWAEAWFFVITLSTVLTI